MKKLFFVMAAVAALLTSCSKDDTFGGPTRGKVTFEVSTPELATRYGEGEKATKLYYAVYDMVENVKVHESTTTLTNGAADVLIDLVEGRKYTAIFWADADAISPYKFDAATKTVSYKDGVSLTANNENYDAFFAFVPEAAIKVGQTVDVDLKRPFAQLNIATNDTEKAQALQVVVENTAVTVAGVYTSFNLATGEVEGDPTTVTFASAEKAEGTITTTTGVKDGTYDMLAMNYVLVKPDNNPLVDVTLNFTDKVGNEDKSYVRQYNDVTVKRNHRTNIIGSILTDETIFDVDIEEGFTSDIDEEHNTSETLVVSTADEIINAFANLNDGDPSNDPGTIVLGDDIDLNGVLLIGSPSTINAKAQNSLSTNAVTRTETETPTIVIDGNGKTISSTATRVIRILQSNINVEINNLTIEATSTVKGNGANPDSIRGISIDNNLQNVSLTLNNCNIKFTDDEIGKDWAYAVNLTSGGSDNTITINGGKYEGANVINIHSPKTTVNIDGATLTSLYPDHTSYYGACIMVVQSSGAKDCNVTIKNSTFNGNNAIALNIVNSENTVVEENNTNNCSTNILYGESTEFTTFEKAIETSQAISLVGNMTLSKSITIPTDKNIILDLNGNVLSGVNNAGQGYLFMVKNGASLTIKDSSADESGKITYAKGSSDTGWTIDLEGELNLESGTIELTGDEWSIGYAVDVRPNSWGTEYQTATIFNMTGGKLVSSDGAVRVASSSADAHSKVAAHFNMTGGEIEAAYDGIFFQQSNAAYDNLNLNISAGTINANMYPVRIYGPEATSKVGDSSLKISGGTFKKVVNTEKAQLVEGLLYIAGGVTADTLYYTDIEVTGGSFDGGEALPAYSMDAKAPATSNVE